MESALRAIIRLDCFAFARNDGDVSAFYAIFRLERFACARNNRGLVCACAVQPPRRCEERSDVAIQSKMRAA